MVAFSVPFQCCTDPGNRAATKSFQDGLGMVHIALGNLAREKQQTPTKQEQLAVNMASKSALFWVMYSPTSSVDLASVL